MDMDSEKDKSRISLSVLLPILWTVLAFAGGTAFSAGMGWGHNADSINNLTSTVARLEGAIDALATRYTASDKQSAQLMQKIEDHVEYNDERINRIEKRLHAQQ